MSSATGASSGFGNALSRRDFLRLGAGVVAGTACLPLLACGKSVAANERIRMGLIGCGKMMGGHHGWARSHPMVEVVALCDLKRGALNSAFRRQRSFAIRRYDDYGDVLARDDIDAVMIATPDHWHAAMAIDAMRMGKDVYVEKPLALTLREGAAIEAAEQRYGRVLQVGSQQRSEAAFRRAAEMVRNGWIGTIREVHCRLGDFPPPVELPQQRIPGSIDYDRWLGQAPWRPYHEERVKGDYGGGWRIFWDYGLRKHGDWGAHHYDIVQWALGRDHTGPVYSVPKGYEGTPAAYFEYADGIKVYRDTPQAQAAMITFIGEDGEVRVGRSGFLETTPASLVSLPQSSADTLLYESTNHRQNWIDCILTRRKPICPAALGRRTLDICALGGVAERLGRPLRWDPVKAEIVGDAEAAAFADYPRREGYPLPS